MRLNTKLQDAAEQVAGLGLLGKWAESISDPTNQDAIQGLTGLCKYTFAWEAVFSKVLCLRRERTFELSARC